MESLVQTVFSLANTGIFGEKGNCVKVTVKEEEKTTNRGAQISSTISFATLTFINGNENIDISIIIKQQLPNTNLKRIAANTKIFWNEVFMYKSVLPFLEVGKLNLFPKMFYGHITHDISNDIIMLEDLTEQNFKIPNNILFLDYDHIVIALKSLAKFHALSYIKKKQEPLKFYSIVENLTDSMFYTENERLSRFFSLSCIRSINLLIDQENEDIALNKMKKKFLNIKEIAMTLLKPKEPYAVICHGDFCRNNIIYKYNDNGKPIDVKFFDLQNSIYSNPAIDLAFFLYLNTKAKLRNEYWNAFLEIYWHTLYKMVPNIDFTYKQFLEHFSKHAIFGMIQTSFFIPVTIEKITPFKDTFYDPPHVRDDKILNMGNEESCKILLEITSHMYSNRYFHQFLEFCEANV